MASLSTCHMGLWLGWQILLNLVKGERGKEAGESRPDALGFQDGDVSAAILT